MPTTRESFIAILNLPIFIFYPMGSLRFLVWSKLKSLGQDRMPRKQELKSELRLHESRTGQGDKSIDFRSDIYSLEVTMFYAVNGTPPMTRQPLHSLISSTKLFMKIFRNSKRKALLKSLFSRLVKKDREQHYQGCNEWQNALQGVGLSPVKKARKKQEKSKAQVLEFTAKKGSGNTSNP